MNFRRFKKKLSDFFRFTDASASPLLCFTNAFSELLECGIPVSKALAAISSASLSEKKVTGAASEILEAVEKGSGLYPAFSTASSIDFPAWYRSFISAACQGGNLKKTVSYLSKILTQKEKSREKFYSALVYPVLLAFMALTGGFLAVHCAGNIGFEDTAEIAFKSETLKTFIFSSFFLTGFYVLLFLMMKKLFEGNEAALVFRSMDFLAKNSVSVTEASESCLSLCGSNMRLEMALSKSLEMLYRGKNVPESFVSGFSEAELLEEAEILEMNLCFSELAGLTEGFGKAASLMEERHEKKVKAFLAALQPVLMFATAVYICMILKNTYLPVMTGFSGFTGS